MLAVGDPFALALDPFRFRFGGHQATSMAGPIVVFT
jgi:hypothetical protein